MKKKNWILTGMVAVVLATSTLISGYSSNAPAPKDNSTCCCQKMKKCTVQTNNTASGELIMENLSRQFLAIPNLVY